MNKLKLRSKIGYGVGDMGISISYFAVGFFFMFYLTDIVGMSALLAGIAIFIGKLWDGINDPFMGIISDRTKSRYGRKRLYILFGAIPFGLSFGLLWMIPRSSSVSIQFIFAVLAMILYGTMYTVVTVPYMAMVPIMSDDYDERTHITGLRSMLSSLGTIIGGGAALIVSGEDIGQLRTLGIVFGGISALSLIIAAQSVSGIENTNNAQILPVSLSKYTSLAREKNVSILIILKILGAVGTGVLTASIPYYADHVLGDRGSSSIGLAIYVVFAAISVPVFNKLTHNYDKRKLLLATNSFVALVLLIMAFFIGEGSFTMFYIACAFLGISMSSYLFVPFSLVPDLCEYYEAITGERHESVFFGLWMTAHQIGIAVSSLVLGILLSISGYKSSGEDETVLQSSSAIIGIKMAFGIIPGLFLILTALILQKYEITREVYEKAKRDALTKRIVPV